MSYKHDTCVAGTLPLWVADMDFATAPCVWRAIKQRAQHPCYGYTALPPEYFAAVCRWFDSQHQWHTELEEWQPTTGVVPALSAVIRAVTKPGDNVVVQIPAYNCFFSSVRNNGCHLTPNALQCNAAGEYAIDYADLERRCAEPRTTALVLCNPHNPTGRLWTPEELRRVADICRRHHVFVISDEIHCEFAYQHPYTPFATVAMSEKLGVRSGEWPAATHSDPQGHSSLITPHFSLNEAPHSSLQFAVLTSPSKAFNIAGLQIANIWCGDPARRQAIDRAINDMEVCDIGNFGPVALMAAYTDEGAQWLDELRRYIKAGADFAADYIRRHMPAWTVSPLEATYLLWVDTHDATLSEEIEKRAAVRLSPGSLYTGQPSTFIRINLATSRATLAEALNRIHNAL